MPTLVRTYQILTYSYDAAALQTRENLIDQSA
jgi:hypothetical protein